MSKNKTLIFVFAILLFSNQTFGQCSFRQMKSKTSISVLAEDSCVSDVFSRLCQIEDNIGKNLQLNGNPEFVLTNEACVENEKKYLAQRRKIQASSDNIDSEMAKNKDIFYIQFWAGSHIPKASYFNCVEEREALNIVKIGNKFFLLSSFGGGFHDMQERLRVLKQKCTEIDDAWIRSGSPLLWESSVSRLNMP